MTETQDQQALVKWCDKKGHPYNLIFAVPNEGKRTIRQGRRMKAEGLKAGVPDLMFPVARDRFHGLFIEMKFGKNKLTENQDKWMTALQAQGYYCMVCYGWDAAKTTIEDYLNFPIP